MKNKHSIWHIQRKISQQLLNWSAVSIGGGLAMLLRGPFGCGFGVQAISWGAIDALIAWLGQISMDRRRAKTHHPDSAAVQLRESHSLRRILLINAGLDVLYIVAALLWVRFKGRDDAFQRGQGFGVLVQGLFLLVFDAIHALKLTLFAKQS